MPAWLLGGVKAAAKGKEASSKHEASGLARRTKGSPLRARDGEADKNGGGGGN